MNNTDNELIQSMDKLYNDIFEGDGRDGTTDNELIFKR